MSLLYLLAKIYLISAPENAEITENTEKVDERVVHTLDMAVVPESHVDAAGDHLLEIPNLDRLALISGLCVEAAKVLPQLE